MSYESRSFLSSSSSFSRRGVGRSCSNRRSSAWLLRCATSAVRAASARLLEDGTLNAISLLW